MLGLRTVAVSGSRKFRDREAIFSVLDTEFVNYGDIVVVHGGAPGADTIARMWCEDREQAEFCFRAKWKEYAKKAGPERNRRMLATAKPDILYAFPLADSKGTWDCMEAAEAMGIEVRVASLRSVNS